MAKKVAILTGWPWYERNIALKSVKLFEKFIRRDYETFILPEALDNFLLKKNEFEKVIPVFHWEYGEDGRIQAMLDILKIPYVWSSYFTNALCMNKKEANIVAAFHWLNVPKEICIWRLSDIQSEQDFPLDFPIILKPNTGWSSRYTYKIENYWELKDKITYIYENIAEELLIQEYILWDEYSVSIVNWEILDAIMFIEKNNKEDFFDYESKYESESGMRETFPEIEQDLKEKLFSVAKKARDAFNVQWYARVDIIVRDNAPYFLEVNTIPGSTEVSILPKAWKLSWRSLEEFVEVLLTD